MQRQFFLNHSKIEAFFKQNKDDFVVTEVPLYEFSGDGEHLILKLRKKDLSTWDALKILSDSIGVKNKDIGYAGLKDKNAMTVQSISIPKKFESSLSKLNHPNLKILETNTHNNKIKIGHLKGNNFFIRLKKVLGTQNTQLTSVLEKIKEFGMPNYFGFQRFGIDGDNYKKGEAIINGELKVKDMKLRQMYLNSFQSINFNDWLSKRVEISKIIENFSPKEISSILNFDENIAKDLKKQPHTFKILPGEVMHHYPYGKIFIAHDLQNEASKFFARDRVPTGILCGKKVMMSENLAYQIEKDFQKNIELDGARRFGWVFAENIESKYNPIDAQFELSFYLPKGSYATVLIEELLH